MVVRSTGFRIMGAQTHVLPPPHPQGESLTSRTVLDARGQGLLQTAAWQPEVRLVKSPRSQSHWCEVHQPFPPRAFAVASELGERPRAASPLAFWPLRAGLRSAELPEKRVMSDA